MKDIEILRKKIDHIDTVLLSLIKERIILMQQTGEAKKTIEKPIRDTQREEEKIELLKQEARRLKISEQLVLDIWKVFFETSVEIEK